MKCTSSHNKVAARSFINSWLFNDILQCQKKKSQRREEGKTKNKVYLN